jgi:uncharacterized protein involved in exopolysaccharide biosynthesis
MKRVLLLVFGIGLIGLAVLLTPSAMLTVFILPERYSSEARVQIAAPTGIQAPIPARGVPYWVQTEAEIVQSKPILEQVVSNLDLGREWGKKYKEVGSLPPEVACLILKSSLKVHPVPNTSLLAIRCESERAAEAARNANEIAKVYCESRLAQAKETAAPGTGVVAPAGIIDQAEPALRPVNTKAPAIVVAVAVSAFLGLSGVALLFLARRAPK